jgi:ribosomal protein L31
MILATTEKNYYTAAGIGQIDFTISCDASSSTHPFYKIRIVFTSSSGTLLYAAIDKFA